MKKYLVLILCLFASTAWAFEVSKTPLKAEYNAGTCTTAITVDWAANSQIQAVTLPASAACTVTFTAPTSAKSIFLRLIQAAGGSGTVTWANASIIKWPSATAPTLSTTANYVDIVSCVWNGTNYFCTCTNDMRVVP